MMTLCTPHTTDAAQELSGQKTKKSAVTLALEEFVARREQRRILDLAGTVDWDPSYDYEAGRARGVSGDDPET